MRNSDVIQNDVQTTGAITRQRGWSMSKAYLEVGSSTWAGFKKQNKQKHGKDLDA